MTLFITDIKQSPYKAVFGEESFVGLEEIREDKRETMSKKDFFNYLNEAKIIDDVFQSDDDNEAD